MIDEDEGIEGIEGVEDQMPKNSVLDFVQIGKRMYFYPHKDDNGILRHSDEPCSCDVSYCWSERCVNIAAVDHNGIGFSRTSVDVLLEGEPIPEDGGFVTLMPIIPLEGS